MEQPKANNQDTFIERVRLQGYKSIEDVEVTLKPGLNILIGGNGSGKTNFVRFLHFVLRRNYGQASNAFQAEIDQRIEGEIIKSFVVFDDPSDKSRFLSPLNERIEIPHEGRIIISSDGFYINWVIEWLRVFSPLLVGYGIPKEFSDIHNIEKILLTRNKDNGTYLNVQPFLSEGLHELLYRLFEPVMNLPDGKLILSFPNEFLENLSFYSPVKDIRLEPSCRSESIKNGKEIFHAYFEFLVDGKWRPWTHLSDGTKRLVYIITEVTFSKNIILLEEPELGIHPHQLFKLMEFLEAEAKHKQIILTTHSPQVLDILPLNEFDRIIIVSYDKENGTKMRHLSEEEQQQARTYMEAGGLDLSDYWIHSDLEKEPESV